MRLTHPFVASFVFLVLWGLQSYSQEVKLNILPEVCKVEWHAAKVTGSHKGLILLKEGMVRLKDGQLIGGEFTMDMRSLSCTDLKLPYRTKLERHLRSPDFFATDSIPTSKLTITSVEPMDKDGFNTNINGDITIKGITKPVSFPAQVKVSDNKFAVYSEMVIDRTEFGIRYGSGSFFENMGDRTIEDEFKLEIKIGAKR